MLRAWLIWIFVCILIATTARSTVQAQSAGEIDALNQQVEQLIFQGRFAEAAPIAEQALEAGKRSLGEKNVITLASLTYVGAIYRALGRFAEAEPLCLRARNATERILGPEAGLTVLAVSTPGRAPLRPGPV